MTKPGLYYKKNPDRIKNPDVIKVNTDRIPATSGPIRAAATLTGKLILFRISLVTTLRLHPHIEIEIICPRCAYKLNTVPVYHVV